MCVCVCVCVCIVLVRPQKHTHTHTHTHTLAHTPVYRIWQVSQLLRRSVAPSVIVVLELAMRQNTPAKTHPKPHTRGLKGTRHQLSTMNVAETVSMDWRDALLYRQRC